MDGDDERRLRVDLDADPDSAEDEVFGEREVSSPDTGRPDVASAPWAQVEWRSDGGTGQVAAGKGTTALSWSDGTLYGIQLQRGNGA